MPDTDGRPRRRFRHTAARAFGKYAWIYPFLQLLVFVPIQWTRTDRDRDIVAYYEAAARAEQGASLYEPAVAAFERGFAARADPPLPHDRGGPGVTQWYYLYPPFLAPALALAPSMAYEVFARAWLILMLVAFWVYALCLARLAAGRVTLHRTLVAGAALGLTPGLMHALNMGQADALVWAFAGLALAFPALRGAGFVAGALTKISPVWPLAAALWREGRRVAVSAAAAVLLAVAVASFVLGPGGFLRASAEWFRDVAPALAQAQFDPGRSSAELRLPFDLGSIELPDLSPSNLSISYAPVEVARRAGVWAYTATGKLPAGVRLYLTLLGVAAPVAAAWFFRKQPRPLHYALVLAAAALFAPIFKLTNVPLLLAPAAAWLGARRDRSDARAGAG